MTDHDILLNALKFYLDFLASPECTDTQREQLAQGEGVLGELEGVVEEENSWDDADRWRRHEAGIDEPLAITRRLATIGRYSRPLPRLAQEDREITITIPFESYKEMQKEIDKQALEIAKLSDKLRLANKAVEEVAKSR